MADFEVNFTNTSNQTQSLTLFENNSASQGGSLYTFDNPPFPYSATYSIGTTFRVKADGINYSFILPQTVDRDQVFGYLQRYTVGTWSIDPSTSFNIFKCFDSSHVLQELEISGMGWTQQSQPTSNADLKSIYGVDANNVWAVGQNALTSAPLILNSTNGGTNWSQQISPPVWSTGLFNSIFMINNSTGWIVGDDIITLNGLIAKTTDGGSNWIQQNDPNAYSALKSVFAVDSNIVYACGNDGSTGDPIILKTTDGGSNWVSQTLGVPIGYGTLHSIVFINSTVGWTVGEAGALSSFILSTTDGGSNWNIETPSVSSPQLNSISAKSTNSIWAVGWDNLGAGLILNSTNGGTTWIQQNCPVVNAFLNSVYAINDTTAYICGVDNDTNTMLILKTINGGITWTRQITPNINGPLISIMSLNSDASAWTVSGDIIFNTTSGGN